MEHKRKLIHTTLIPIRWGDMDAFGHVNNTIYFRYMEQARIEWLAATGAVLRPEAEYPVIIDASCTFLLPLTHPGTVEVRMFAGAPGRSSIPTYYELRLEGDPTLYAEGASKIVWTDSRTNRSCPIPESLRAYLLTP